MAEKKQAGKQAALERARGGKFAPGSSGNPAGRPKGSRNRVTQLCSDLLADDAGEIVATVIKRAKKGDDVCLKLCLERLVPCRGARDRTVDVELPEVGRANDLVSAAAAVVDAAAGGRMTLSEAKEFMALLEGQRKLIETTELMVRIEALEDGGVIERPAVDGERFERSLARELGSRVRVLQGGEEVER